MREQGNLVNLSELLAQPKVLQAEAAKLQRSTALEVMMSRGIRGFTQYGIYFGTMWLYSLKEPERARIILSGNFYWRWVDDVRDKDRSLPARYSSMSEFLRHKYDLVDGLFFHPGRTLYGDREDIMLLDYYVTSKKRGIDLGRESKDILATLIWDEWRSAKKGVKGKIFTQEQLDKNMNRLDFACIDGALKVGDEACTSQDLASLSWATRTFYNLRDCAKDLTDGLINISAEDLVEYGIDLEQLRGRKSVEELIQDPHMRRWYADQTAAGLKYLDEARNTQKGLHLKWDTRAAIYLNFVRPAKGTLRKYAKMLAA